MKFRFTNHGNFRIFYERGISAEGIKKVIGKPDTSEHIHDNLIKSKKVIDKRTLTVVYSRHKDEYVIITAYFQ